MKIFLDDQFDTDRVEWVPDGYTGARDFDEFKTLFEGALARGERVEAISFDNDLGEGKKEGWEIAKWLTQEYPNFFATNPTLGIHSANPSGRKNIERYLMLGIEHHEELIEAKTRPDPWGEMKMS